MSSAQDQKLPLDPLPGRWWERIPPWGAPLVALVVLGGVTLAIEFLRTGHTAFITPENLSNIAHNMSFVGIVAIGMTLVIALGGIDLSVGSLVALSGGLGLWVTNLVMQAAQNLSGAADNAQIGLAPDVSSVHLWLSRAVVALGLSGHEGWALALGALVAMLTGAAAGWLQGLIITRGRVAAFIVTLGGFAAFRSLVVALADGGTITSTSPLFNTLGQWGLTVPLLHGHAFHLYLSTLVFILTALVGYVLLNRMRFGRYLVAIGCNERSARYSAIPVNRIKILAYTFIGLLSGLAGLLVASYMISVTASQTGSFYELDAIAAVVIGGTRLTGGRGTIVGTVLGVLLLGVISNMLNMLDVSNYLQGLVKGIIIVAAALLQRRSEAN